MAEKNMVPKKVISASLEPTSREVASGRNELISIPRFDDDVF